MLEKIIAIIVIAIPFYLNDFLYIDLQQDAQAFYLIDYSSRLITLFFIFLFIKLKVFNIKDLHLTSLKPAKLITHSLGLILFDLFYIFIMINFLFKFFCDSALFQFPGYPDIFMKIVDLLLGVGLVSISEEFCYRGIIQTYLRKNLSAITTIFITAVLFSLAHWGSGIATLVGTFIWGLVASIYMEKGKSLWPLLIAHYVIDFIVFF